MKLRGAIFDLDGTLLDSMQVWETIGEEYLRSKGIKSSPDINDTLRPLSLAQAADYMIEFCGLCGTREEIIADVNKRIEQQYYEVFVLKPGANEFLTTLKNNKIPMCVATATDRHLTEAVLKRLGVLECFKAIFTCTEVKAGKDKPDIYLKAQQALGTHISETFVFEDTLRAINTAKRAGFKVVGVLDQTSHSQAQEIKNLADFTITDFKEFHLEH